MKNDRTTNDNWSKCYDPFNTFAHLSCASLYSSSYLNSMVRYSDIGAGRLKMYVYTFYNHDEEDFETYMSWMTPQQVDLLFEDTAYEVTEYEKIS